MASTMQRVRAIAAGEAAPAQGCVCISTGRRNRIPDRGSIATYVCINTIYVPIKALRSRIYLRFADTRAGENQAWCSGRRLYSMAASKPLILLFYVSIYPTTTPGKAMARH